MKPAIIFSPLRNGISKKNNVWRGMFRVVAPEVVASKNTRRALNLSFCIDVSGSMSQTVQRTVLEQSPATWVLEPVAMPWVHGNQHPVWMAQDTPVAQGMYHDQNHAPQEAAPAGYRWVYRQGISRMHNVTKLDRVVQAASKALDLLKSDDILSVVAFESSSRVVVPAMPMTDANKSMVRKALQSLHAAGGTGLHGGWAMSAEEVCKNLDQQRLNRVVLLTDGVATDRARDIDWMAGQVSAMVNHHISTSTMGVGLEYNEHLLQALSDSGDGRYFYLEDANAVNFAFEEEVEGSSRVYGNTVRCMLNTRSSFTMLNGFKGDSTSGFKLPNAMRGKDEYVLVEFTESLAKGQKSVEGVFSYMYTDSNGKEQRVDCNYCVPVVSEKAYAELQEDANVGERVVVFELAKAKKEALDALHVGDTLRSTTILQGAQAMAAGSMYAASLSTETARMGSLLDASTRGDFSSLKKMAHSDVLKTRDSYDTGKK